MIKFAIILFILPFSAGAGWPFDTPPYAFVGADVEVSQNSRKVCYSGSDSSNMGLGQSFKVWNIEFDARWTHHSCITEGNDANVYDGVGVQAKFYLWDE